MREQQSRQELKAEFPESGSGVGDLAPATGGVQVLVKGIVFSGYEGLASEQELQGVVAGAIGRYQHYGELRALSEKVSAYLQKKGWFLAKAYLPKQEVTSGMIRIDIVQGKSDAVVRINRAPGVRICGPKLQRIARLGVRPGEAMNDHALEHSVLLMNDLPGVSAKAALSSGSEPGSSQVDFMVAEGPLASGVVWIDNQGNRYSGSWRGSAMVSLNDPLRFGDQLTLMTTVSDGLEQGRVDYSAPLLDNGLRGSLGFSGMHFHLGQEIASLNYKGAGTTISAGLSYPLLRSLRANVTGSFGLSFRELRDTQGTRDFRDRHIPSVQLGCNGYWYDTFLSQSFTTWRLTAVAGNMHESIADIRFTGTDGGYTRFNTDISRLQRITDRLTLRSAVSSQFAPVNLDSSEKFFLGGPDGVRAYPIGEASGDLGQLLDTDLLYSIPMPAGWGSLQLSCFYDAGHIKLNRFRYSGDVRTATGRNEYWLQGAGAGLVYSFNSRFSMRGSWAHTIGDNPGRSVSGKNADGRSDKSRFWLQASLFF